MNLRKKEDVVKSISAKDVWKNDETNRIEEKFMSPFIVEHLDEISNITGYDLEMTNMELFVGDFRADIVCKDTNTGDVVVIENQLDQSDHDHLGKALTYLANLDAKGIIWICENVRPEHLKAVEKLNEIPPDEYNFYFLELKFETYNDDIPYYDFNKVVVSSNINKLANQIKNHSEGFINVNLFFEKFINEIKNIVPTARINKGKTYHTIYHKSKGDFYCWMTRSPKDMDTFKIELGYNEAKLSNENDKIKYREKYKQIEQELNLKYGYTFEECIGKRNLDLHKLIYSTEFDEDNMEFFKELCQNVYKVCSNIWNE